MGFLRRLFGGGEPAADDHATPDDADGPVTSASSPSISALDEEAARDRELLRDEARRLDDDLIQRQMRYADRSWTPPAQGGTRRADDADAEGESGR